jgi:hypothetical protein
MSLLFLLLSLWALSFAQDNPIRVFVNLAQSTQIAPDIYILTLNIFAEADKEIKALSLLGRVDRELSQLGLSNYNRFYEALFGLQIMSFCYIAFYKHYRRAWDVVNISVDKLWVFFRVKHF